MAEKILLGAARRRFLGGGAAALLLGCFASCGPSGAEAGESQAAAGDAAAGESQAPSGDERTQRKQRSEARLKAEGVRTLDHLPAIETAAEAKMRGAREVAERLLALTLVAVRAEGLLSGESPESARAMIDGVIRKRKAAALFTPKEKAFISALRPAKDDQVQFLWRYEAAWVLAWALRWIDGPLSAPRQTCDVPRLSALVHDSPDLSARGIRRPGEILDEADLIYRYHWASMEAIMHGAKPPTGLDPDVIVERHHALNWLIGYQDQPWDEVTTDT